MTRAPAVLVTGASGFIGVALVERLLAAGYSVRALSRTVPAAIPRAVRVCRGDLSTGDGIDPGLLDGIDAVFHCAGEVRDVTRMRQVHVEGTRRLLATLGSSGARPHWIQLSSVGAYGPPAVPSGERAVDEKSPENPSGEYELTKTESDRLVLEYGARHGLSTTILRPASVIGARMSNASVRAIIAAVQRRRFFYVGRRDAMSNYVHVDDVADALVACAASPAARGQTFNLSSDCTWVSLIEHVARRLGVAPPRLRVPEALVRQGVAALGGIVALPLTQARISALVGRTRYPTTKIETLLGFGCRRPMPDALDELIAAAR